MSDTRVKMDMVAKTIELEGSEAFVTKYLEEFKVILLAQPAKPSNRKTVRALRQSKQNIDEPSSSDGAKPVGKPKRARAPRLVAEKYDIHGGNGKPSLKEFFDQKNPGKANGDRIAVIGYYITEILGNPTFSEGQVEYSFKMLGLDRPAHLHQIMINTKNERDYYEQVDGEHGRWNMTRGGDIFVTDKLPPKESE